MNPAAVVGRIYVTKKIGYILQALVIYTIQVALYYEIYVNIIQPIHNLLREIGPHEVTFNLITGLPLYFAVNIYYFLACVLHPGKSTGFTGDIHCNLCDAMKPERTSHCARCETCVVVRDHHCDFTNKCIGSGNFKCFYWFLTSAMLGCFHFLARSCQWFYYWYRYSKEMGQDSVINQYSTTYLLVFVLHIYILNAFFLLITKLWLNATLNICFNLTKLDTLGLYERPWLCSPTIKEPVNSYDMGLVANWVQYFGMNPFNWLSISPTLRLQSAYLPASPEVDLELFNPPSEMEQLECGVKYMLYHLSNKTDSAISSLELARKRISSINK
jgi:hypothetical protein